MQGTYQHFHGKVALDEAIGKFVFVTELPGFKAAYVSVKFDRIAKLVSVVASNGSGISETRSIQFSTDQIIEYASLPRDQAHLYEFIYPEFFEVQEGILAIWFGYIKTEVVCIPMRVPTDHLYK